MQFSLGHLGKFLDLLLIDEHLPIYAQKMQNFMLIPKVTITWEQRSKTSRQCIFICVEFEFFEINKMQNVYVQGILVGAWSSEGHH